MAVGFGTSLTGSWADVDQSDWSGFYSDSIQEFTIDFFAVDGTPVDPYDGAQFSGSQLETLIVQLESAIGLADAQPEDWPLTTPSAVERYFEACKTYAVSPLPPRDQAIRTFREAIALAQKAIRLNHFLVFCGD
jgi:hypothetical protein